MTPSPHAGGQAFPPTRHSVVVDVRSADPAVRERGLRTIADAYWRPITAYLRLRWRTEPEDAEDLCQGFFVALLERDLVARFDPERARFRTYLRTCLDRFVLNAREAGGRVKRGGEFRFVPLEVETEGGGVRPREVAADGDDPEELFRQEWTRTLFARAVDALRAQCVENGRDAQFAVFERYDLHDVDGGTNVAPEGNADLPDAGGRGAGTPPARPSYADLSNEFGIPVTKVTNDLHAMRRRFRAIVLDTLRELTATDEEFRAEARDLFGVDP
jgi:DNA-directed RNA polymerase specialized sigma24 family protein